MIGDDDMENSILCQDKLRKMRETDIKTIARGDLVDLLSVKIDEHKPIQERVVEFVQQVKNPYCFRIGDIAVKVVYQDDGPSFQQNFEDMLMSM